MSAATDSTPPHRLASLDGLRGVASAVVVLGHSLLTIPAVAAIFYPGAPPVVPGSALWFAAYTPLHLLWGGTEAVYLFFVLSGIVLVLPVLATTARGKRFSWLGYYPRRIVRLYGPVLAAVGFALALAVLVPRTGGLGLGQWMDSRPEHYAPVDLLRDATLVTGSSGFVSPLWTLRWEVLFSLLLPVYVWAVRTRRFGMPAAGVVAGVVAGVAVGSVVLGSVANNDALFYLSIFGLGAVAVAHWTRVAASARRVGRTRAGWPLVAALAVLLTVSRWLLLGLGMPASTADRLEWVSVLGVCLVVYCGAFWGPLRRTLETRIGSFLGRISFSLYLVHEPIIIAVRLLLRGLDPWVAIVVAVPLAVGVATVFARFVELPLHRLARATGAIVTSRSARATLV